jgi:leucyl-tRNA synthetase
VPTALAPSADKLRRAVHRTVAAVTDDLEKFRFNRGVARIRELTNLLEEAADEAGAGAVLREGLEVAVRLIGPMMPHLAEEMWQALGHRHLLADEAWPKADPALVVEDTVTVAVQVNGKLRGTLELPRDAAQSAAETAALELPAVQRLVEGRKPRKVILVPNRIVNVVV